MRAEGKEKVWHFRGSESSQGPKIILLCLNQNKRRTKWFLSHFLQLISVPANTGRIWAGPRDQLSETGASDKAQKRPI